MSYRLKFVGVLLTFGLLLPCFSAYACTDDQYESCFLGACVCMPKVGGDIARETERIKREGQAETLGSALAQWIIASRNLAIGTARPIPARVREALNGYVEQDILSRVRYKVGDNGVLNLSGLTITYGDRVNGGNEVQSITLVDLVVFRNESDAQGNCSL